MNTACPERSRTGTTTKSKPPINADFRELSISYKILFHNELENRHLKNTHKKQEDERLYYREHGFLFATACPERSRMGSKTIIISIVIPAKAGTIINNQFQGPLILQES
jgi:hypothetical protein